jgi:antitoxin ParD1/3/4
MQSQKISVSLPLEIMTFIERYKEFAGYQSHSQVISEALLLLQSRELEQVYRQASEEVDSAWEVRIRDGLNDETW